MAGFLARTRRGDESSLRLIGPLFPVVLLANLWVESVVSSWVHVINMSRRQQSQRVTCLSTFCLLLTVFFFTV